MENKPIIFVDEFRNLYIGTITRNARGELVRGECYYGDAESFYRNAIINIIALP